jgi:antitoxin component YwqK of YwqJK toxin-antitoxin module
MTINSKNNLLKLCFTLIGLTSLNSFSQKYVEPDQIKQFNITVNYEDYTVKTQMLKNNKSISINNERIYMWYASQKIMETKGGYEGKLIHGKYTSFYLNNQLKEQGHIKYGLRNKEWKYWYADGKLKEIISWKNGVKNGTYCLYNDYGQLMAKSNFKNDKLHGKFYTYGLNGIIIDKKKFKNGEEIIPKPKVEKVRKEKIPKEKKVKEEKPKDENSKTEKPKKKKKEKKSDKKEVKEKPDAKIITS